MTCKRRKVTIYIINVIAILLSIFSAGCLNDDLPPIKQGEVYKDFSVNFIDVGQGDCIFIRLPDGKNLLIDCGLNDVHSQNSKLIIEILKQYSVDKIDYFILTHPDLDHIGNAKDIIVNFSIGTMYVPHVSDDLMNNFDYYESLLDLAEEKKIKRVISDYHCIIKEDQYVLAFLSPVSIGINGSSYDEFESTLFPTDTQINNLSPIIYFECFDKRFIFTGDAGSSQERIVLKNYNAELYDFLFASKGIQIDLENIDYLKVSHHGSDDATKEDFISLLKPKNFIISVGRENFYGHPRTELIERIFEFCPESKIYRTDQVGTITVHRDNNKNVVISTAK